MLIASFPIKAQAEDNLGNLKLIGIDEKFYQKTTKYNSQIGFGIGIPYGGIGTNLVISLNDYFVLTGGAGFMKSYFSAIVGTKIYFRSPYKKFRPRLSLYAGNIGIIAIRGGYNGDKYDGISGTAVAVGYDGRFSDRWSFDFDIIRIFYSAPEGVVKEGGDTMASVGINYHYNDLRIKK